MTESIPSDQHNTDNTSSAHPETTSSLPTYAMYQRKPHTISATSLSVEASSSAGQGKDATHRLQIQQLRASAQNLGLPSDSVGYKILEALATEPASDEDISWQDVLTLASSDKVSDGMVSELI